MTCLDGDPYQWLRPDASQAFRNIKAAAAQAGIDLHLNSSFRAHERQQELYDEYLNGTGNSPPSPATRATRAAPRRHRGGRHLDGDLPVARRPNAGSFGLVRTVSSEPWHWEFLP